MKFSKSFVDEEPPNIWESKVILICPGPDHQQEIVSLSEKASLSSSFLGRKLNIRILN